MNARRQQRDIDKARVHLYRWAEAQPDCDEALKATVDELVRRVAVRLGQPGTTVRTALAREPLGQALHAFALVDWITGAGGPRKKAPLARYVTERGWRESPLGKRWLRLLAESDPEYRDIVSVVPDEALRARPGGTREARHRRARAAARDGGRGGPARARAPAADAAGRRDRRRLRADAAPPSPASSDRRRTRYDVCAAWAAEALISEGHVLPATGPGPVRADRRRGAGVDVRARGRVEVRGRARPAPSTRRARSCSSASASSTRWRRRPEASPHEAEIALRRCQSLMARFGITESDLETREFATRFLAHGRTTPMHLRFLGGAVAQLHDVVFVTGGGGHAEFRGYAIDTEVAAMTLGYLMDAVERALSARRRAGNFPAGRSAAYDYRIAFAVEVDERVDAIVAERRKAEAAASPTGTALTVRKREIVRGGVHGGARHALGQRARGPWRRRPRRRDAPTARTCRSTRRSRRADTGRERSAAGGGARSGSRSAVTV